MPAIKVLTTFKSNEGYGWTELHYRNSADDPPNLQSVIDEVVSRYVPARRDILGSDCSIVGVRCSFPRAGVIASQSRKMYYPGFKDELSGSWSSSLAFAFFDATRTRHKVLHLRGFWDSVESAEAYHPEGGKDHAWASKLSAFVTMLSTVPYGWLSKDAATSSSGTVSNYVADGGSIVTFTVATTGGAALVPGETVSIRFSRLNHSKSVLNSTILCTVINPTSVRSVYPVACGPFTGAGRYNLRRTAFVAYAGCGDPTLGERRMGAPLGHYPGRAKAHTRV
jgi:hypothetical protein